MLWCLVTWLVLGAALVARATDARTIIEAVYRNGATQDASWRAVLEVVDKKGKALRKKFIFRRLGSLGDSKTLVRFTDPAEVRGVGLLSINRQGVIDRQWIYTPAIRRVRRIAPQERSRRFLGTDFTYEDMAERVLDDFQYRLLDENEEIDGARTYKVESRPNGSDRSQYDRIYSWVRHDAPCVVHAEMYGPDGRRLRVLHASQLERISGIWVVRRVEMTSPSDQTRTLLVVEDVRFNTGLKEDLFTQQSLEKLDVF